MSDYKYDWYKVNMYVACLRCGNKLPMQSTEGSPTCDDCGEAAPLSWEVLCKTAELEDICKGETSNRKVFGAMEISMNTSDVEAINCDHCQEKLNITYDPIALKNCECPSCKKELIFEKLNAYNNILFYRFVKQKLTAEKATTIAVRCAACGAPLQTDPGKVNYNCTFCGVENILPVSLRQRRVLDDVFAGVQKEIASPKNILTSNSILQVTSSLKENKREAFSDETLNGLMEKFPDNLQIYHLIVNDHKYELPISVFEKLWETSKSSVFIKIIGNKLNKSESDITSQIRKFDKNFKKTALTSDTKKEEKSLLGKAWNWLTSP